MNKIAGVIYPVPSDLVGRLLVGNRNIFVKYLGGHAQTTRLRTGAKHKVLFYASRGTKELVGEGVICGIEFLTPKEVLQKYDGKVFLNRTELMNYATREPGRESSKKMLVLVLSKTRAYSRPLKCKKPVTMAGQYVTRDEYNALMNEC